MNQTEIKIFATLSILIGAAIWLGLFLYIDFEVYSSESLKALNLGATAAGLFWFGYFKWAWKWRYIRKLLYKPNVNGTWLGEFKSDWKNEQGKENPPRRFVLVVRQHWFSISVRAFSDRQKTDSYVETLMIDAPKGIKLLAYLFSEKRIGNGDHGARQGAAELELIEDGDILQLEGHFWTQAGTRGYIKVKRVSSSDYAASFDQAGGKWNDSSFWESLSVKSS
ncbi:hypothetical protein ACFL2V_12505 [Pseudomonadota bacterium]